MAATRQGEFVFRTWGGHRPGAGRPAATNRRRVAHRRRFPHDRLAPAHVTLRARGGLPSLRDAGMFLAVRRALATSSTEAFRLLHFSVQGDHLHLLVEADSHSVFTRG